MCACLRCAIRGRALRSVRVGTGFAFISPCLVGVCGPSVWVRACSAFPGWGLRVVSWYRSGRNLFILGHVCVFCVLAGVSSVPRYSWLVFVVCGPIWASPDACLSRLFGVCPGVFPRLGCVDSLCRAGGPSLFLVVCPVRCGGSSPILVVVCPCFPRGAAAICGGGSSGGLPWVLFSTFRCFLLRQWVLWV